MVELVRKGLVGVGVMASVANKEVESQTSQDPQKLKMLSVFPPGDAFLPFIPNNCRSSNTVQGFNFSIASKRE